MLKKTKFIYASLLIVLLVCLIMDITKNRQDFSYLETAYFVIFLMLSIYLIFRGFLYKVDTNLYFGMLLLISPISQILLYYNHFSLLRFLLVCSSMICLSSFVIWKYFKDKTHKKIFFVFIGEILIFLTPFCLTNFSIWYLILIAIGWLVLAIVFCVFKKIISKR